jgi:predicted nucleotidyltransferase
MQTRESVVQILNQHRAELISQWPIAGLWLYGSVARGEQSEASDVDLLVELSAPMGWNFFDLAHHLETLLGVKVDLIPKAGVKPHYWQRIAPEVVEVLRA